MDDIDAQIVHILEQNARQSSKTIAKHLNISSATVRRRLKRMFDANDVHVEVYRNVEKSSHSASALIGLNIDHELHEEVMGKIAKIPEVVWASTTTGQYDGFAYIYCDSADCLYLFLRDVLTKIPGIKDSETFVCLHTEKSGRFQ